MLEQQGYFDPLIPVKNITGNIREIGSQFPVHVFAWIILQCIQMYPAYDFPGQNSLKQIPKVCLHIKEALEKAVMDIM
jgi:hypothetical protein